ncbi:MAG: hypothetical protein KM310_00650 [Clostridiales bacterium]|nr:hypothetical protein [Clostridiales bacterium]
MITDDMKEKARNLAVQHGLDPDSEPFRWIRVRNQEQPVLYADRTTVDQLMKIYGLSADIIDQGFERFDSGILVAWAKARVTDGAKSRVSLGAVRAPAHSAFEIANALMKAETKAVRRAVIRFLALPVVDESELDTMETSPGTETSPGQPSPASPPPASPRAEERPEELIKEIQQLANSLREIQGDLTVRSTVWNAVPRKVSKPEDYSLEELRRIRNALQAKLRDSSA